MLEQTDAVMTHDQASYFLMALVHRMSSRSSFPVGEQGGPRHVDRFHQDRRNECRYCNLIADASGLDFKTTSQFVLTVTVRIGAN